MPHLTLTQLQELIKDGISAAHPLPYWIVAEVSEAKVNYSGHCYLELVEKGGDNHIPKAKISATIWRGSYKMLNHYFASVTGQEITAGIKLLVKAHVGYHELYGLSLNITDINPSYTLGDMERQRQETIAQLREDGIYDMNRELELPIVLQRLAVISSANAAGYQDFMNELNSSPYRFAATLFDAFMQGAATEDSIISALGEVAERTDEFDAVIIIRGGGSQSDLGCFDSYRLSCHVAQFPLPVIAGIGHDKDVSVIDMVAAVTRKTPTAVAVYLKDNATAFDIRLDDMSAALYSLSEAIISHVRDKVREAAIRLKLSTIESITGAKAYADNMQQSLSRGSRMVLQSSGKELALLGELVATHSPDRVLERGFSIVRHNGRAVKDASKLNPGDRIEITTHRRTIDANVEKVR